MRAQDIPCMTVSGYAVNSLIASGYLVDQNAQKAQSTDDRWNAEIMERMRSNHAWNEVYVNNRWIIVDATWDSRNAYRNQKYISASHINTYFDISIETFSKDHRIMEYGKGASDFPKNVDFQDVTVNDYFYEPVRWAVNNGIVMPTGKDTFSPNDICENWEVLISFWRVFGNTIVDREKYYDETIHTTWDKSLLWAYEHDFVADGSELNNPCTRSQIVSLLWHAAGCPEVTEQIHFADVAPDADYAKAVSWAVSQGITSGTSATTFSPDAICTRGQMVTFLYRLYSEITAEKTC